MSSSEISRPVTASQLPEALVSYRHANRLSQDQLARLLGVTQQSVARWEKGAPPRPDLLATVLAVLNADDGATDNADLADVISLRYGAVESASALRRTELQDAVLTGLAKLISRGERLPDDVLRSVVRAVGLMAPQE